jgi:tetratricopeptide (TPR) repeat protein
LSNIGKTISIKIHKDTAKINRFVVVFGLVIAFSVSAVFAQQANPSTSPIPVQNNAAGRMLRAKIDTVEFLLRPVEASDFFTFRKPSRSERDVKWQRAFDSIETIAELAKTDSLAKAHYFFGKGLIYRDKAWSGLLGRDSSVFYARKAIQNFEDYIRLGFGNPAVVYESLAMMYFDFLKNPNQALQYLDLSLTANPNQVFVYVSKAQILQHLGRVEEVCDVLKRARRVERLQVVETMITNFGCR